MKGSTHHPGNLGCCAHESGRAARKLSVPMGLIKEATEVGNVVSLFNNEIYLHPKVWKLFVGGLDAE
jgi:hypothetical protein